MNFRRFSAALPLATLVALAACVPPAPDTQPESTPTPTPIATPQPTPTPAPVAAPAVTSPPSFDNWMDAPQTPGDWIYRPAAGWSESLFGLPQSEAHLVLRCTRANGTITIIRAGQAAGPVQMRIRTETRDGTLQAQPSGGPLPTISATVPANDPLLDAMALSKGRFAVETDGMPTLYIPAWPEVTRVVEDCRA